MARGQRKTIEEKISEKEELIQALRTRLKSEQNELDSLYREKRDRDLEGLNRLLEEASDILQEYLKDHMSGQQTA